MAEAHDGGLLIVSTSVEEDSVRISIVDDGPGIPPEHQKRIFDPFFTTKDIGRGTGLGLSICYGIVQRHGGELWAESTPQGGATFHIALPIIKPEAGEDMESERAYDFSLEQKSILVVDDEPAIRELLARMLASDNHRVVLAASGEEGWSRLQAEYYDRIILDLKMPGMNGRQLYRLINDSDRQMASRVIFITGDTMSSDTHEFISLTGNPSLSKPFQRSDLRQLILDPAEANG